jgi:hypothetical protein
MWLRKITLTNNGFIRAFHSGQVEARGKDRQYVWLSHVLWQRQSGSKLRVLPTYLRMLVLVSLTPTRHLA